MTKIKTYNPEKDKKAAFFIQCKGLHSGRVMREPIPNCWAVYTDVKNAYEICFSLWKSRAFYPYIGGTCIPFMRLREIKPIILKAFEKQYDPKKLDAVQKLDITIENLEKQLDKYKELQAVMAKRI